ncbi:TetR/AcrR family transcriptional regulator [Nocardia sp. 2]|uniref:TetR/AcrR family transcriptional regulator n=1 Tax=Nocardia acididurans TaxID=2802282 RepID=A0ABS1M708_9NOCA|nr:TetR/AcrR family transcriptional regulator [Nocardia acididurans]MBL1075925.1 TetR/AcrR family transcriptional regulator [Nocardia acididurans]
MAESTRDRILAEATSQLLTKGYPAFTVAAVRDALGLSSGSMFHAFPSKPALAAAVYVTGMRDYQRAAVAGLATSDPEDAVRAFIAAHLAWVEDHRDLARFLFATQPPELAAHAEPELAQHNREFYAALTACYRALPVAGALGSGTSDPGGYPAIHAVALGPAQEYCRQWVRGTVDTPPRTLVPALQQAAIAGLRALGGQPGILLSGSVEHLPGAE